MGMPLLQSVISVLRETWDFNLDPVRQLVLHLLDTNLRLIGNAGSGMLDDGGREFFS